MTTPTWLLEHGRLNRDVYAAEPPDIRALREGLEAAEQDARRLVAGLSGEAGAWRPALGAWSVAECLDHLGTGNIVYLDAMVQPALSARARGMWRRGPAKPGLLGTLFIRSLEPPPRWWSKRKAPPMIRPRPSPPLRRAFDTFIATQARILVFLQSNADLDLARISFPNPFISGVRFSLATGLHVIVAHERRHLYQAWGVRRAAERAHAGLAPIPEG
jgi:hypothetical protein